MIGKVVVVLLLGFMTSVFGKPLLFVAENLPPYHFIDQQQRPAGALVEVVEALTHNQGIKADIKLMPFARCYQLLTHQSDVFMFSLLKTPARQNQLQWVGQVYKIEAYLVGLKNRKDLKLSEWQDAKKYTVGTIRGYYAQTFLQQAGFTLEQNLSLSVKYQRMWKMLFKQRIDLVLTNNIALTKELTSIGLDINATKRYWAVKDFPNQLHIVTHLDTSKDIVASLGKKLDKLKKSGRYQQIMNKWGL